MTGFDLIFKNGLSVFLMRITTKLILNVAHYGWVTKKMIHSRSSKMTFLSY